MKFLDVVALVEDLPELNLYRGNVGTIVEEYEPNVCEVEFSDTTGKAYAIETLNASQLMILYHHPLQTEILIIYTMNQPQLQLILQKVKQALNKFYQDKLEKIILYGSQARGDASQDSDIDILVVLKSAINPYDEIDKTSEMIANLCLEHDVVISRHFISSEKFNHQNTPFIDNVKREGITI